MKKTALILLLLMFLTACQKSVTEDAPVENLSGVIPVQALIDDKIVVESPFMYSKVESPLVVSGEARGIWFFEGSFPVILLDTEGNILAEAPATSPELWMTEEFIPFEATLEFSAPEGEGVLVLMKDNPSGLEELDEELRITVSY